MYLNFTDEETVDQRLNYPASGQQRQKSRMALKNLTSLLSPFEYIS